MPHGAVEHAEAGDARREEQRREPARERTPRTPPEHDDRDQRQEDGEDEELEKRARQLSNATPPIGASVPRRRIDARVEQLAQVRHLQEEMAVADAVDGDREEQQRQHAEEDRARPATRPAAARGDAREEHLLRDISANSGSGKKTSAERKRLAWMLKYGRSERRLSETKKPRTMQRRRNGSRRAAPPPTAGIRHCRKQHGRERAPSRQSARAPPRTRRTDSAPRAAPPCAGRARRWPARQQARRRSPTPRTRPGGSATNASAPSRSSRAASAALVSARNRQKAVPA